MDTYIFKGLKVVLPAWQGHCKGASVLFFEHVHPFCFLGSHLQHMEVPRLGVEWERQLPAYTTATAMLDPLTHWARPGIEPTSSWILVSLLTHWATTGTPEQPWWRIQGSELGSACHLSVTPHCARFTFNKVYALKMKVHCDADSGSNSQVRKHSMLWRNGHLILLCRGGAGGLDGCAVWLLSASLSVIFTTHVKTSGENRLWKDQGLFLL